MAIDTSIYGQVGQGVPQVDVVGSMAKGLQLREALQARDDDRAMRALSTQAGGNLGQLADLAQGKGLYKQAQGLRSQDLEYRTKTVDLAKKFGEVDKQKRDAIQAANEDMSKMAVWADTPEKWAQGVQGVLEKFPFMQQGLQPFMQFSPEVRKQALIHGQSVKDALELLKPKVEDRNGAMVPVTTDVLGQQTVGAPVAFKAQTEPAKATQDLGNGLIDAKTAADLTKKSTTHGAQVVVNTGEKLPPGWRIDPQDPSRWTPIPGGPHDEKAKDKPLTEAQGNALGFGIRAREADVILSNLESQGADVAGGLQRAKSSIPLVGNYLTPTNLQEYDQAKRNFVSAVLRKESGAAISEGEFKNEDKKYFPQPGDSPEVMRQKAEARKTAIGVLQIQAGRDLPEEVKPVKPVKPKATAKAPNGGKVWTVKDDNDYKSLPPGAHYKGPDGVERVK